MALLIMNVGSIVGACMGLKVIEPPLEWLRAGGRGGSGGVCISRRKG